MHLPRLPLPSARAALHRPAVVVPVTALALAGLLGGGLLVANAVDGPDAIPVSADATPTPSASTGDSGEHAPAGSPTTGEGSATTSGGDDNVAVAVNTRDGSTVYAVRLKVVLTDADVVDAGNAAVAVASCSDCQTVAIALEGVLVTGDAEVVAPENIALAINSGCSGCQTLAYAYQNLQTFDGRVRLTGEGRRRIGSLRAQLNGLRTSGLDVLAVKAEVDRIAGEFAAVLADEVVPLAPTAPGQDTAQPAGAASPAADGGGPSGSPTSASPAPASPAPSSPEPTPPVEVVTPTPTPTPSPSGG